ncbi:TRAP transporter permease DctQ [Sporosarcina sp. P3]|nr:TRAP transporter permease DctQ [Sporosarcina sp. P3]
MSKIIVFIKGVFIVLFKFNNLVEKILTFVSVLLLATFIIVVFVKVIARNYFDIPMVWADEFSLLCFMWTVFLGAAIALRHKKHFIVDLAPSKLKLNLGFDILSHFIVLSLIYVMIVYGYNFTLSGLSRASNSLPFTLSYFFATIPVSGVAMLLFTIELIITDTKRFLKLTSKEVYVD